MPINRRQSSSGAQERSPSSDDAEAVDGGRPWPNAADRKIFLVFNSTAEVKDSTPLSRTRTRFIRQAADSGIQRHGVKAQTALQQFSGMNRSALIPL